MLFNFFKPNLLKEDDNSKKKTKQRQKTKTVKHTKGYRVVVLACDYNKLTREQAIANFILNQADISDKILYEMKKIKEEQKK